jgi:hypothetical protein
MPDQAKCLQHPDEQNHEYYNVKQTLDGAGHRYIGVDHPQYKARDYQNQNYPNQTHCAIPYRLPVETAVHVFVDATGE